MSENQKTKEPQYRELINRQEQKGFARLGLMSNLGYFDDPKHLVFVMARYKFVSKILSGKNRVCEIGCADAFATPIVAKEVGDLTALDFDPLFIDDAKDRSDPSLNIDFIIHDLLDGPVPKKTFNGIYACDVFEHIDPQKEDLFIANIIASLAPHGVLVLGMPSLESQVYASEGSREGHVNCKSGEDFKSFMEKRFHNVFLFSMNDEVVHTGFSKMAHYLFVVCCDVIN